jgi:hypothetical protein
MSNDKTIRKMTPKMFLHRANGKVSAIAFLAAHRAFLETGELCEVTSPILRMLDDSTLLPTPALELIREAVTVHHIRVEAEQAERKLMASLDAESTGGSSKTWEVTVYDSKGNIQSRIAENGNPIELQESFLLAQRASEWADRRLVNDCGSDCFAVITHVPTGKEIIALRNEAMSRCFPKAKAPMSKKTGSRDNKLSWGSKCVQSHAHFSRG